MYILPCPFCGDKATEMTISTRVGHEEFMRYEEAHVVTCDRCGASSRSIAQETFADRTHYKVQDFRNNPSLRARVEDEYDTYVESLCARVIYLWNKRE
jgi:hypothetical protein